MTTVNHPKESNPNALPMLQRVLGIIISVSGLALILLILFVILSISATGALSGMQNEAKSTMFQALFILHVPLILGLMMMIGGLGLFRQRPWSWNLVQVPAVVVVVMSVQVIFTIASGAKIGDVLQVFLPAILGFQVVAVSSLVLLNTALVRKTLKVKSADILVALLFACILILDWLVTLYDAIATAA